MIELVNVGKTFHTVSGDVVALKNINLTVNDGDIFGIIGLSGAGKSTLVRCINLLEKPTEGSVLFNGKDLTAMSKKDLLRERKSIGMIFQGFNLLEQRNALRNICYPLEISGVRKEDAVKRARELLELVGLSDKEKAYPCQLSGGQKQRVAIARALATNPQVLLCDEATSALDPNTTKQILDLLKSINQKLGVTIIVITHEMKVIEKICSKVAVIDNSSIVEEGYVSEVFENPKSNIAKELILPGAAQRDDFSTTHSIRITFDGMSSYEPVVSDMTLKCSVKVNILFADTRSIDGKAYGQMLIQMPEDPSDVDKIKNYLNSIGIKYKEVGKNG